MSAVISAIFDDVDTADLALADIRRAGVTVEAYRVKPVYGAPGTSGTSGTSGAAVGYAAQPSNYTSEHYPIGVPAVAFGGVLGVALGGSYASNAYGDVLSREIIMLATVAEHQAADAQSFLVSAGGRQVHTIG
ncbi:MAG: hypothetical protein FWH06_00470 [Oscillospiraceae bacterium]|nr:hypothetical protein [Oscillospiraceae bacterium]